MVADYGSFVPAAVRRPSAWLVPLILGSLAGLGYLLLPGERLQSAVFVLVGVANGSMILWGVRLNRPQRPLPWIILGTGVIALSAGDAIWTTYDLVLRREIPYPSYADVVHLAAYAVIAVSIALLILNRGFARDWGTLIDATIIATGLGTLTWVFLMAPYAHAESRSLSQQLVSVASPLVDVLLISTLALLALARPAVSPAHLLLLVSTLSLLTADITYGWLMLTTGGYHTGHPIDLLRIVAYLLWSAAALHPSMRDLSDTEVEPRTDLSRARLASLAGAALVAPIALVIQHARDEYLNLFVIVGASAALFLLALLRLSGLAHAVSEIAARDRTLRQVALVLVAAKDRDAAFAAAVEAARSLLPTDTDASVVVCVDSVDGSRADDARSEDTRGPATPPLALDLLPARLRADLSALRSVEFHGPDAAALAQALGQRAPRPHSLLVPIVVTDRLVGCLVILSGRPLGDGAKAALDALSAQAAVALERSMLVADLHRRQSEERFRALVQHASDIVAVLDDQGVITFISPAVEHVLGFRIDELLGTSSLALFHPDDRPGARSLLDDVAKSARSAPPIEMRLRHRDGSWRYVELIYNNLLADPAVRGVVVNGRDVTERKAFEDQLTHQAFHDPLTGLPNRSLFMDRLDQARQRARRHHEAVAVLFLDLDRFKIVNDSLGHAAGDRLLVEVARRLRTCLREADTVARLGGDEFTILMERVTDTADVHLVAERIAAALQEPLDVDGREVFVSTSIGVALSSLDRDDPVALMRDADLALYRAKARGRACYEVFDETMSARALERLELESQLRRGLERGEFVLFYQPRVELETGRIEGFEALVRWQHPQRGLLSPAEFVPLAEETGLIRPLGQWVIEEACRQGLLWHRRDPQRPPIVVSVNLSAAQFQQPHLAADVARLLQATGFPPALLELEITESVIMDDAPATLTTLRSLKELGIRLAIDDFGTGYSSLAYLKRFPVDTLKIDKAFVEGLDTDAENRAIVQAVVSLATTLGLRVTAEGVETPTQAAFLRSIACESAQGYHFGRPLHPVSATDLLAAAPTDGRPSPALLAVR